MRILALFTVLLFLTLHGQSQPLGESIDQVQTVDHQGTETKDQTPMTDDENTSMDQIDAEGTGMTISFEVDEHLAQDTAGQGKAAACYCRRARCQFLERLSGWCRIGGLPFNFCCR
ncbi:defensin alpha 5-like [Erinaceus europaeus]|uniref:Defensin alpha 5-like n=1 Tax=Erinaceus europaeus TaxID=9365 RepID=A0A1S3W420_ERIEU|nr:defensin alpha 5-like [Erinaceus europaeus]